MNRLARDARACMCLDFAVYHILNKWAGMFEGKILIFVHVFEYEMHLLDNIKHYSFKLQNVNHWNH